MSFTIVQKYGKVRTRSLNNEVLLVGMKFLQTSDFGLPAFQYICLYVTQQR